MESLAMLVAGLLLAMLVSSLAAVLVSWRARTRAGHFAAIATGVPGALLGVIFIGNSNTLFGAVVGLLGLSGFALAAYRTWKLPRPLVQD